MNHDQRSIVGRLTMNYSYGNTIKDKTGATGSRAATKHNPLGLSRGPVTARIPSGEGLGTSTRATLHVRARGTDHLGLGR